MVFSILAFIALMMIILARVVRFFDKPRVEEETITPKRDSLDEKISSHRDLDPAIVAAITAAVTSSMKGKRFRIASLAGYDVQTARWAMAGRQRMLKRG